MNIEMAIIAIFLSQWLKRKCMKLFKLRSWAKGSADPRLRSLKKDDDPSPAGSS
jgi:hypothetical protein